MKPDRKIPLPVTTLESRLIRHFITSRMTLPYQEKFYIILRRFKVGSRAIHAGFIVNIRHYIPQ
jgi:hypothetical protein